MLFVSGAARVSSAVRRDIMRRSFGRLISVGPLIGVLLALAACGPSSHCENSCINNLRQLDGAKQTWALEERKTTNDVPTWDDLRGYMKFQLVCPQGGAYTIGRVGDRPKCSIPQHRLPDDAEPAT